MSYSDALEGRKERRELQLLRKRSGLTRAEICELLGIRPATLIRSESHYSPVDPELRQRLIYTYRRAIRGAGTEAQ